MKNSKKKIIAICASCALMTSMLAGCGDKEVSDAIEQVQNTLDFYTSIDAAKDIKHFNYDIDIDANLTSGSENMLLGLDLDGMIIDVEEPNKDSCTMNMAVTLVVPETANIKDLDLTSVVMKDNIVYINVKKLIQALPTLSEMGSSGGVTISEEEINAMFTELGITSDYVKINLDEVSDSMIESGVSVEVDTESLTEEGQKFIEDLTKRLENAFGSLKTQFIGKSGEQYTFQITNADLGVICDCITTFINNDLLAVYDNFVASAESMGYSEAEIEELKASRPTADQIANLIKEIEMIKDGTTEIPDFKIDCWTTFAGSKENADRAFASKFSANVEIPQNTPDYSTSVTPFDGDVNDIISDDMMNFVTDDPVPSTSSAETITMDITANIKISEIPATKEVIVPGGEHADLMDIIEKFEEMSGGMYTDPTYPGFDESIDSPVDDWESYDDFDYPAETDDYSYMFSDDSLAS